MKPPPHLPFPEGGRDIGITCREVAPVSDSKRARRFVDGEVFGQDKVTSFWTRTRVSAPGERMGVDVERAREVADLAMANKASRLHEASLCPRGDAALEFLDPGRGRGAPCLLGVGSLRALPLTLPSPGGGEGIGLCPSPPGVGEGEKVEAFQLRRGQAWRFFERRGFLRPFLECTAESHVVG